MESGGEPDDRLRRPATSGASCRAGAEQEHQRPVSQLIGHVARHIDRRGIRPVQVLDEDHQGLVLKAPLDQDERSSAI